MMIKKSSSQDKFSDVPLRQGWVGMGRGKRTPSEYRRM